MKKLLLFFILLSSFLLAKPKCIVSILPLESFVSSIAKDKVSLSVAIPPGESPHTYEPKPSFMKEIAKANCYFAIGVEFEKAWLPRFKSQNPNMLIVDLSKGIKKLPMGRGGIDPHIWTSPTNIKEIAKKIYQTLVKIDAKNREFYKKNYENFLKEVKKIDKEIKKTLAKVPPKAPFMVFHPSWGYFAKEYNLTQIPIELEGKEPKPRQLMELIKEAKRKRVKAIFTQPEFSTKSARVLARELNIPIIKVSPLSKEWKDTLLKLAKAIAKEGE